MHTYFLVYAMSNQNCAIHLGMRNMRRIKVRQYTARLVDLNKYLDSFPGVNITDKIGLTNLNGILLEQSGECSGIIL